MAAPSNKTLSQMLTALRAECGHSTNNAHGLNDREASVYLLDRVQQDLIEDYDWPFLAVDRLIPLIAGTRYYPYPADLRFEDINSVWLEKANEVYTLTYDITPYDFQTTDSRTGAQSWPVRKYRHHADDYTMEVWPIPDGSAPGASLRLRGTMTPAPLVLDTDLAVLPWRVIVLTAAAEVLAKEQDPAAQTKASRAAELIRRLRVRTNSHKGGITPLGGTVQGRMSGPPMRFIPSGYGQGPPRV